MDDEKLVRMIRQGNKEALEQLMDRYTRLLWVIVGGILQKQQGFGAEDIEETVSDVFIELWQNIDKFDPEKGGIKLYLSMLARSRAKNRLSRERKDNILSVDEFRERIAALEEQPEEQIIQEEESRLLYETLAKLSEPTKSILLFRYFYEMKPKAIAKRLSLEVKEVNNRLYRGKKQLADLLQGTPIKEEA